MVLFNDSIVEYYKNSMKLLGEDVRHGLYRSEVPIYTKVRDAVPTLYGENGSTPNYLVADGCHLFGFAENSIIFREVEIEEHAEVRDCVLMQGSKIGAGAKIQYAILDKNVVVRPGTRLLGSPEHPLIINKGAIV